MNKFEELKARHERYDDACCANIHEEGFSDTLSKCRSELAYGLDAFLNAVESGELKVLTREEYKKRFDAKNFLDELFAEPIFKTLTMSGGQALDILKQHAYLKLESLKTK